MTLKASANPLSVLLLRRGTNDALAFADEREVLPPRPSAPEPASPPFEQNDPRSPSFSPSSGPKLSFKRRRAFCEASGPAPGSHRRTTSAGSNSEQREAKRVRPPLRRVAASLSIDTGKAQGVIHSEKRAAEDDSHVYDRALSVAGDTDLRTDVSFELHVDSGEPSGGQPAERSMRPSEATLVATTQSREALDNSVRLTSQKRYSSTPTLASVEVISHAAVKKCPDNAIVSIPQPEQTPTPTTEHPQITLCVRNKVDLIMRSNDAHSTHFLVDSSTVYEASPVLRFRAEHLCIPVARVRREHKELGRKRRRRLQSLEVDETATALEALLRLIYRQPLSKSSYTYEDVDRLFTLCCRYRIDRGAHYLCSTSLRTLAIDQRQPIAAYGLACAYDLDSDMPWIAHETLKQDLMKADLGYTLARCTPDQIRALVQMHKTRAERCWKLMLESRRWDELECDGEECCQGGVAEWWDEVLRRAKGELEKRPCTSVVFSTEFLLAAVRVAARKCERCWESFLSKRAHHRIGILKDEIDALPVDVSM